MIVYATRGPFQLLIASLPKKEVEDGPCIIRNTRTGEEKETTIQTALKWGYWEIQEG